MAFKSAERFNHSITLPFGTNSYRIDSPPISVGNFVVESVQAVGLIPVLTEQLQEARAKAENDPLTSDKVEELEAELDHLRGKLAIPKELESEYFDGLLGSAYRRMVENHEPYELVKLASATVSIWILSGLEEAEEFWNNGGRHPKAPQDRKAKRGKGTSK